MTVSVAVSHELARFLWMRCMWRIPLTPVSSRLSGPTEEGRCYRVFFHKKLNPIIAYYCHCAEEWRSGAWRPAKVRIVSIFWGKLRCCAVLAKKHPFPLLGGTNRLSTICLSIHIVHIDMKECAVDKLFDWFWMPDLIWTNVMMQIRIGKAQLGFKRRLPSGQRKPHPFPTYSCGFRKRSWLNFAMMWGLVEWPSG